MLFNVPIIMCRYKKSLNSLWLYYPWTVTFLPHSPYLIHHQILTLETLLNSTTFSPHSPSPTPIQTTDLFLVQPGATGTVYISPWDPSSLSPENNPAQAITHYLLKTPKAPNLSHRLQGLSRQPLPTSPRPSALWLQTQGPSFSSFNAPGSFGSGSSYL